MNIRQATPDDAVAVEAIHFASRGAVYQGPIPRWAESGPNREQRIARWAEWLSNDEISCLVAELEGKMVGFVTTRASQDDDVNGASVVEMPTLYVHPDHWRAGIGGALCNAAVEAAKSSGYETLTLWVVDVNHGARAFYESYGFTADGAKLTDRTPAGEEIPAGRYRLPLV